MSESIDPKLAAALVAFQSEVENPKKNAKAYNYKYAPLDECMNICRPILAKHGLAIIQYDCKTNDRGEMELTTMLVHSSGASLVGQDCCPFVKGGRNPVQDYGATQSYLRRYAYQSMLGIVSEDDSDASNVYAGKSNQQQAPKSAPTERPQSMANRIPNDPVEKVDAGKVRYLRDLQFKAGVTGEQMGELLASWNLMRFEDMNVKQYAMLVNRLSEKVRQKTENDQTNNEFDLKE